MQPKVDKDRLLDVGYDPGIASCGRFLVLDHSILEASHGIKGLEVLPLADAMDNYPHVRDNLVFRLIEKDKNEFTKTASNLPPVGYYIKVEPGVKIDMPFQAGFLLESAGATQVIHNIIELGENSEAHIINGCTTSQETHKGRHIGITETYLGRDAALGYTMIHNWARDVDVYPIGAILVGENARYISNYAAMTSVKKTVSYPVARVMAGGSARFYSIIYSRRDSYFDTGAKVMLEGDASSGEIISRVVSDGGAAISRQMISGSSPGSLGHMECSGLLLGNKGVIHSIPELKGGHQDIDLSHEASVGRISKEDLSYLMTRGLTDDEARSLIIRGFLDIKIKGIPYTIQQIIDEVVDRSVSGSM
ncbi:MAG: SufD family Fe-S cluster assembly protein [Deltaproteobacteria bacterium]|nr:SufD family Fe-S cluster assembly protein [Deltaproteobacteria bacterium]